MPFFFFKVIQQRKRLTIITFLIRFFQFLKNRFKKQRTEQPMSCLKIHYAIPTNYDRVMPDAFLECDDICRCILEDLGMQCATFTRIDEKVISFRKQNIANSDHNLQAEKCTECISKVISLCVVISFICSWGFPNYFNCAGKERSLCFSELFWWHKLRVLYLCWHGFRSIWWVSMRL